MKAKVGGDTYRVTFAHVYSKKYKMVTMCNIWIYNTYDPREGAAEWTNLNYGMAKCGLKDNFCKETGRKIALTRALRCFDDKEFRTAIWNAYFHRDNKGITQCKHKCISEEVHVFCDECGEEVDV